MSVVLVTGSCGLVGSETCLYFSKKDFQIIGIDNNFRKKFFGNDGSITWMRKKLKSEIINYKHYNIDVRNYKSLSKVFKKYKHNIKLIVHAAAQPSHDYAKLNARLDFDINALGTLNLLTLTEKYCKYSPFIHMSTNKVYGDNPNKIKFKEKKLRWEVENKSKYYKGIDEKFSMDSCIHSFFGVSKVYSDLITQEFGKNNKLNTVVFRAGCITGPNHSGVKLHGFLSYLIKLALKNNSYNIIGYKGKQVRDNIHSNDLINCFWEYFKKPKKGEVYNIGGGRQSNCSILEAIKIIEKLMNKKLNINYSKKNRIGDHIWYISDNSKFMSDYPYWRQKYNINRIIEEVYYSMKV